MSTVLEKGYSKAKAAANRVTWTDLEVMSIPFLFPGTLVDGSEGGVLRMSGREMVLVGLRAFYRTPPGDAAAQVTVSVRQGDGTLVANSSLVLRGIVPGGELAIVPNIPMPANSIWKARININAGDPLYYASGLDVTYLVRFSNGPLSSDHFSTTLSVSGVGYWTIGGTFVVK